MTTYHQLNALSRLLASLRTRVDREPILQPPRIPIAEGNGGIRLRDISDPMVPVQVVIAAYQQMQINDRIDLFWNDRLAGNALVDAAHLEQGSVTINVPSVAIQDGTPPVHYVVTSAIGQNEYQSHPLYIRVKTNVPGGTDPIPSTPEVNENLLAVIGVPELVDDSNADSIVATVPSYENMTEGDKLRLSWGGYFVEHELEPAGVNQPVPMVMPRDIIEQAGAGPVVIEYEVRDVVNNWSLWSIKFTPDVEVGAGLLRAPDALDVVDGELDLTTLGDEDAAIRVRVYPDIAEHDVVALSWIGRPPTGGPILHDDNLTVDYDSEGLPIEFQVPNAVAKASAGGTVAVKYSVTSNRGQQHSRRTSFEVIGQVQKLPAPSVKEALGDELDPVRIPPAGATVTILAYSGMKSGDRVDLFVRGTDANGAPFSHNDGKDISGGQVGMPIDFIVPKGFFEPLVNGSVDLYYRVNGEDSDNLELKVVGQGGAELPAPSVNGVENGILDPDAVPAGTKAMVPNYQGKAVDDRITLNWSGLPEASYTDYIDVTAANLGSPIGFDIAYEPYVIGNLNSSVAVSYRVMRAGGGTPSSAVLPIQVQRNAGEDFVAPTVLEAPTGTLDPLQALSGATVRVKYDGMLTTDTLAVSWAGTNGADTWQSDPEPGNVFGYVDVTVPISVVAASQGKTITVLYGVERNGLPNGSLPLELQVEELTLKDLPAPIVPQANQGTGVLALESFPGDASVTVVPWPLIAEKQRVWVKIEGILENGSAHTFYPANGVLVTSDQADQGLDVAVLRTELEKLKGGAVLTVMISVAFDGANQQAQAIDFPTADYTLEKLIEVQPTITSVKEPGGAGVPNGGTTVSSSLTLSGRASVNQTVEILDGDNLRDSTDTDESGAWSKSISGLTPKSYAFKARGDYGTKPESTAWNVTVQAPTPPLTIDTNPVTLNGAIVRNANVPTNPPAGAYVIRTASGGKPPYRYAAQNPAIADVDSTSGKVISRQSGSTDIVVTDQDGKTARYTVTCSNIQLMFGLGSFGGYNNAVQHAADRGGRIPSINEWNQARSNGATSEPGWAWTSNANGIRQYAIIPNTGQTEARSKNNSSIGWGIKAN